MTLLNEAQRAPLLPRQPAGTPQAADWTAARVLHASCSASNAALVARLMDLSLRIRSAAAHMASAIASPLRSAGRDIGDALANIRGATSARAGFGSMPLVLEGEHTKELAELARLFNRDPAGNRARVTGSCMGEKVDFLESVIDFKKNPSEDKASRIYGEFVKAGASREIRIKANTRWVLKDVFESGQPMPQQKIVRALFNEAEREIARALTQYLLH